MIMGGGAPDVGVRGPAAGGGAGELMNIGGELQPPSHRNRGWGGAAVPGVFGGDRETGGRVESPADTVLLAVGMAARQDVADSMRRCAPETEVFVVGDALQVGNISGAVRSAFKAAAYI